MGWAECDYRFAVLAWSRPACSLHAHKPVGCVRRGHRPALTIACVIPGTSLGGVNLCVNLMSTPASYPCGSRLSPRRSLAGFGACRRIRSLPHIPPLCLGGSSEAAIAAKDLPAATPASIVASSMALYAFIAFRGPQRSPNPPGFVNPRPPRFFQVGLDPVVPDEKPADLRATTKATVVRPRRAGASQIGRSAPPRERHLRSPCRRISGRQSGFH